MCRFAATAMRHTGRAIRKNEPEQSRRADTASKRICPRTNGDGFLAGHRFWRGSLGREKYLRWDGRSWQNRRLPSTAIRNVGSGRDQTRGRTADRELRLTATAVASQQYWMLVVLRIVASRLSGIGGLPWGTARPLLSQCAPGGAAALLRGPFLSRAPAPTAGLPLRPGDSRHRRFAGSVFQRIAGRRKQFHGHPDCASHKTDQHSSRAGSVEDVSQMLAGSPSHGVNRGAMSGGSSRCGNSIVGNCSDRDQRP